ncbi:3b8f7eed-1997-42f7-9c71-b2036d479420 [Sclerotinia trifoliorum]|uniref:3b8f7eed-1997-42f7-9c71-b2036d479420 n=1 Tax=Sclerotinia trifoliorum TaxID=28548 RepID=A0A8H2VUM9_9HELO|nr:3b8f7eed-1997-42f7-9c71-b2036d479420 [Sclerotinia trifoliorum]
MANSFFTLFLSSIALSSIYWLWMRALAWSARNKAGCSSAVKYKHLDPFFGFDLLSKKIQYTKAGNLLALDDELFAKYGKTLHTLFFGRNHWMTMDPLLIQTVAATEADKFGSAPSNRKPAGPLLGDGAFTTDGHMWKRSRELLQPVFSRSQVSQLSGLKSHMERFLERIPRDGSTIDIQPLAQGLFLDSSMEFIFGKSSGTLSPSEKTVEAKQFSEDFDEGLRGMRNNYMTDKISWLVGPDKKWLAQCAKIHSTLEGYIDEEIEIQKQSKLLGQPTDTTDESSAYKHILLKELVKKYPNDKTLIRNELMNVFFAARDSVGTVTSSMLFLLARSPESWEKLRKEVAAIPPEQELTFEFLKSLKYVQAVIDETLRLIHPVDRAWRTCLSTCILPRGGGKWGNDPILLQPGDQIELIYGCMHKDKDIWGEDASKFNPDRMVRFKHSWKFIPFSGGRRTCPAQQNAYTDMAFFLVRMVQEFKTIQNRDDCFEYVEEYVMTKSSRNGVKVAFSVD